MNLRTLTAIAACICATFVATESVKAGGYYYPAIPIATPPITVAPPIYIAPVVQTSYYAPAPIYVQPVSYHYVAPAPVIVASPVVVRRPVYVSRYAPVGIGYAPLGVVRHRSRAYRGLFGGINVVHRTRYR